MKDDLLNILLDNIPYSVWLRSVDGRFLFVNEYYANTLNLNKNDIINKTLFDIYDYDTALEYSNNYKEVVKNKESRLFTGYSGDRFLECYIKPIYKDKELSMFIGILKDETERKQYEEEVINKNNLLKNLMDIMPDSFFYKDINGKYLDCNVAFAKDYYDLDKEDVIGKIDVDLINNDTYKMKILQSDKEVIETKKKHVNNIKIVTENDIRYMESIKTPLINQQGEVFSILGIGRNITDKKNNEKELIKISYKDKLTGMYNRTYFDKKIEMLDNPKYYPLTILMGDIDGLKIVNDSLGHLKGDELLVEVSNIVKKSCRKEDLIIRWGGDEIIILMPNSTEEDALLICQQINQKCSQVENSPIPISISLGYCSKLSVEEDVDDILKKAEERLYKDKLTRKLDSKKYLINILQKNLSEKSIETKHHTDRVVKYASMFSEFLGLTNQQKNDLLLVGQFHDIGKIGIPDEILLKPSRLTDEEMEIVKKHTEKGYRIAKTSHDISHISNSILSHHERWDGNGYPMGLKEYEIPYLSRIISVIDSYDAMTGIRPYRQKLSKEEAIKELKRCSGSQFDLKVVEKFIEMIENVK